MSVYRELGDAIDEFLLLMSANGRRPPSIRAYAGELDRLYRCLPLRQLTEVTPADVSRFLASPQTRQRLDRREKAPTTVNRTKAVIRAFFTWCENTGKVQRNPASLVRVCSYTPPVVYMTRREVRHFLACIERADHQLAVRDHALLAMLAYTGLRLPEVAGVRWADLNLRRRQLLVRSAKGGRPEVRHISRRLLDPLIVLRRRAQDPRPLGDMPVFRSTGREALSPRGVQYRFTFWLTPSGICQRCSVHSLRHTFATLLYRATGDLLLVSRALGHRDIRATLRYAHVEDDSLIQGLDRL